MLHPERADAEAIDALLDESANRLGRRPNDGLLVHVEARIEDERNTGECVVGADELVVQRVRLATYELRARGPVHMHDSRNALAPFRLYVVRDRHELRSVA